MKIYFEDGELLNPQLYNTRYIYIDAKYGPTYCNNFLEVCRFDEAVDAIYTNYVEALSTTYSWNAETTHIDIFLRHPQTKEWTPIERFHSGLRISQSIPKMYLAGVFSKIEED